MLYSLDQMSPIGQIIEEYVLAILCIKFFVNSLNVL